MSNLQSVQVKAVREAYLDDVAARLRGRLTPLEAYEAIEEMRAHLDAMAAAYVEVGLDPSSAMDAALAKFGRSEHVGIALASTAPRAIPIELIVGLTATTAVTAVVGVLLMAFCDVVMTAWNPGMRSQFGLDLIIGALVGTTIAVVGWFVRMKPAQYGGLLTVVLNLFLHVTLYQTYVELKKPGVNLQIEVLLTPSIFLLGFTSVVFARRMRSRRFVLPTLPNRPMLD